MSLLRPCTTKSVRNFSFPEETTQHPVEIPTDDELVIEQRSSEILKKLDEMIDRVSTMTHDLSPLKDLGVRVENIELLADQVGKRAMTMMSTLPDPREAVPWKRRKIITMPRILEDAAGMVQSRRVLWTEYESATFGHPPTLSIGATSSPPRGTDSAPRRICILHHCGLATSVSCPTPSPTLRRDRVRPSCHGHYRLAK